MRIKRLELHGFKSFADRQVLTFGDGISCVVGSNGCGKSNVVDAMRWAIGEQSARSLRGAEMQDVIFAGSADRKPVGYAEVGITFTTEGSQPFPGEYARFTEIQVARRLYRSGASEYLINQARCRRKDIVDLFLDTGIGNNLYSFIEQGRIDKIVSASAEDRRSLIDEAAGITRYRKRRAEALSKLASTGAQLDRAADVADEMERRLRSLERQVVKAARFRRLRALLRQDEVFLSLVKYADLDASGSQLAEELKDLQGRLVSDEATFLDLRDDLAVREGEVDVATVTADSARDALAEVDARLREVQAAAMLQGQREQELARQVEAAVAELADDEARAVRAREQLDSSAAALDAADVAVAEAEGRAHAARRAVDDALAGGAALRDRVTAAAAEAEAARNERTVLEAKVAALEQRAVELPDRIASLTARLEGGDAERVVLAKRRSVADEVIAERTARMASVDAELGAHATSVDEAVRRDVHAKDAVGAAERGLDAAQGALDEAIAAAETTAGQAEEEVAARVGRVQQAEDNRLRDAERADDARLAEVTRAARAELAEAEGRARAWVAAVRRDEDAQLDRVRAGAEASVDRADAEGRQAVETAVSTAETALAEAEASGQARVAEALAAARTARDDTEAALAAAREALGDAEARLAVALRDQRELEGQIAALEAEARALEARDAGAKAVRDACDAPPSVLDRLDVPADDRPGALALLGDRAFLPVVAPEHVTQAQAAADDAGAARLWLDDGAIDAARVWRGVAAFDTLEAAVAHHRDTGEAAALRDGSVRIDADGVLHLGGTSDEAAAAWARREALEAAREALAAATAKVDDLEKARTAARAKVEGASIRARRAAEKMDAAEHEARDAVAGEIDALRTANAQAVAAARERRLSARTAAREAADAAIAAASAARAEVVSSIEAEAEAVLDDLRTQADTRLEALSAEIAAAKETRRAEAAARVEQARDTAWTEVRATTADVAVRRERLREEVGRQRQALDAARRRALKAAEALETARAAGAELSRRRAEDEVVVARVTAEREAAVAQAEALEARIAAWLEERAGLQTSLEDVGLRRTEATTALETVAHTAHARQAALETAREALASHEAGASQARGVLDEAEQVLSAARERKAGLLATRDAAIRELEGADARSDTVRARIGELEHLLQDAKRHAAEARTRQDQLATERQTASTKHEEAKARLVDVRARREQIAKATRDAELALDRLRRHVLEAESKTREIEAAVTSLLGRMEERYQLDLPATLAELLERHRLVLAAPPEARAGIEIAGREVEPVDDVVVVPGMLEDEELVVAAVGRVEEHRAQLGRIGDVHLGALEEYEELRTRFDDLDTQKRDLEESVDSIREAIATINETCRERFRETFDLVDEAFRTAYPSLVGGGEARLELTDEEDLLETGVDILVRPPGKRMQHLGLMSGGEKAMTAIALIMALFRVKPSPFCVLDEVDAPLDEANGARFNGMLRELSTQTQFLVITHNRKTMECADTHYGVTMPTPGVSVVVATKVP